MTKRNLIDSMTLVPFAALSKAELDTVLAMRNEEAVRHNMYNAHIISPDEHAAWLQTTLQNHERELFGVFVDKELVGVISLDRLDEVNKRTDWAFYLGSNTQGRGMGSALEFLFLDYVFGERGFEKLNCEVLDFNEAVISLHKRFGFQQEGVRRRHIVRGNKAHDAILLGITKAEWNVARPALAERYGI